MSQTTQLGSTGLFANRWKRSGDKRPDFTGEELVINCPHCLQQIEAAIAIWQRTTRNNAPMLSISINTRYKKEEAPQEQTPQPEQQNAPQATPEPSNGEAEQAPQGDDIPF